MISSARLALAALAALAALVVVQRPADAGLGQLEREFQAAIERSIPATVVVSVPGEGTRRGSSGVIVARSGLVLTDWDVGSRAKTGFVEVRVPDAKGDTFVRYKARVVQQMPEVDSSLLRIEEPPLRGFPSFLAPGTSDGIGIGSFTLVAGNSFDFAAEGTTNLTAGIVAAVASYPVGHPGGRHEWFYTTAAVNPGVNGGPVVDVQGRLVGIVSTWVPVLPDEPYQYLGRVVPVDRLRAAYAGIAAAKEVFAQRPPPAARAGEAAAVETVIRQVATGVYPCVASLVIERSTALSSETPGDEGKVVRLQRYDGASSAVIASADGLLVTSLYNLTNVTPLLSPGLGGILPPTARPQAGIEAIQRVTAKFPDGRSAEARVVAWHEVLGIAVLKADVEGLPVRPAAPRESYRAGRFVVPVANPNGARNARGPLVSFGILSKRHSDDSPWPWRGQWQTDASATDGNCGAAVADVEGRLVGVLTLWTPIRHGRNSGIGFVVPWTAIEDALPAMAAGRSFRRAFLGISWDPVSPTPRIGAIVPDTAAARAGLQPGDAFAELDGTPVASIDDCMKLLARKWAGDPLHLVVRRGDQLVPIDVVLGVRE